MLVRPEEHRSVLSEAVPRNSQRIEKVFEVLIEEIRMGEEKSEAVSKIRFQKFAGATQRLSMNVERRVPIVMGKDR